MPNEGLPKTKEDKITRRTVLGAGALALGSLFVPNISGRVAHDKIKVSSEQEKILEEIAGPPYPSKEGVPQYLHEYMEKFKNWREVVEAQKTQVIAFLGSDLYRKMVFDQFKDYFQEKEDQEINKLVDELIKDRIKNFSKTKFEYKKLKDELGIYFPTRELIQLDTTLTLPINNGENKQIKTLDMFVTAHEYFHTTLKPGMMSGQVLIYMLKLLANSNSKHKDDFARLTKKKSFESDLNIDSRGRTDFHSKFGKPREQPEEIPCFLMQIRIALHNVYNTAIVANMPKYDMCQDVFTEEHYDFLETNQFKIFSTVRVGEPEDTTIFREMTKIFGKSNFIEMMNKIV